MPYPDNAPPALRRNDELRRRGFIEGQNLTIDFRDYRLHSDLISEYAAGLVKAQVDVIEAGGAVAIRAAQQATRTLCRWPWRQVSRVVNREAATKSAT
ncbi:MAG: hypothetical protein P4L80_05880, partial [Xanthobacteraceae bacterium]|nr:hypothetical protein [Xanthobacteraceae bacterium]